MIMNLEDTSTKTYEDPNLVQSDQLDRPYLTIGHTAYVRSVVFSADGLMLISAGDDKRIIIWELKTGREMRRMIGHQGPVLFIALSPDGGTLASASSDTSIKLWDVASGNEIYCLKEHSAAVRSLVFSHAGQGLISFSDDNTAKLWKVTTGQFKTNIESVYYDKGSVTFSASNNFTAFQDQDGTIQLQDKLRRIEMKLEEENSEFASLVIFSPDESILATLGMDRFIRIWDVTSGRKITSYQKCFSFITAIFSPDGKTLIISDFENNLRFLDPFTGQEVRHLIKDCGWIVGFSPDTQRLVTLRGTDILFWDAQSGQQTLRLKGHSVDLSFVAVSPDGRTVGLVEDSTTLTVWDLARGYRIHHFKWHESLDLSGSFILSFTLFPKVLVLVGNVDDRCVKIIDVATVQEVCTINNCESDDALVFAIFSPSGQQVLVSGDDQYTLKLCDTHTGCEIRCFNGHPDTFCKAIFSPDGRIMASYSQDEIIKLWDVATGKEIRRLKGHKVSIISIVFSPDGTILASASEDETVKLWQVSTGLETDSFNTYCRWTKNLSFFPDGQRLAWIGDGGKLVFKDVVTGKKIYNPVQDEYYVDSFNLLPDGQTLALATNEGSLHLWDLVSQQEIVRMISLSDGEWMAITPSGFFNASPVAAKRNIKVYGGDGKFASMSADIRQAFYRPNLLADRFGQ